MGNLWSTDRTQQLGGPKSFYLVLGGPRIQYTRPTRGPLIFDVEPIRCNTDDLVEQSEVVRPTANVNSKQKFTLIPSQANNASLLFKLQFKLDYVKAPASVKVFIDAAIEYGVPNAPTAGSVGNLIRLVPNRGSSPKHSPHVPLFCAHEQSRFPAPQSSGGSTTLDIETNEFSLQGVEPSPPKASLTEPMSLKQSPLCIVVQYEAPPPQSRSNRNAPTTPAAADDASDITCIHTLYTFVSFEKDKLTSTASGTTTRDGEVELGAVRHPNGFVTKQYLEFSGEVYELEDIYDLGGDLSPQNGNNEGVGAADGAAGSPQPGGEVEVDDEDDLCVICLTNPKNTTVIPCRHMCLCSECAVQLRQQSNKCPICRRAIERLMTM